MSNDHCQLFIVPQNSHSVGDAEIGCDHIDAEFGWRPILVTAYMQSFKCGGYLMTTILDVTTAPTPLTMLDLDLIGKSIQRYFGAREIGVSYIPNSGCICITEVHNADAD